MDKRIAHLILGTRGGLNRGRILSFLRSGPRNANAIATGLALDYKTVRHHLDILRENDLVMPTGGQGEYGTLYALSPRLQMHYEEFEEVWKKLGEK